MSNRLFGKWRRWLHRIYNEQLLYLLINQHIFRQLAECTTPYVGTNRAAYLAQWMKQGYVAFAGTAVRRMLDDPAEARKRANIVSLVVLLRDVEQHAPLFTRKRFRKRYTDKRLPIDIADQDFYSITRNKRATCLSASRVRRDIKALGTVGGPVRRLVNKVIAHTERDRRKVGKVKFTQLDDAIQALAETFRRYWLLIQGTSLTRLAPFDEYDVLSDLKKIWP